MSPCAAPPLQLSTLGRSYVYILHLCTQISELCSRCISMQPRVAVKRISVKVWCVPCCVYVCSLACLREGQRLTPEQLQRLNDLCR